MRPINGEEADVILDIVDETRRVSAACERQAASEEDDSEEMASEVRHALTDLETVCTVARQYGIDEFIIQGILLRNLPEHLLPAPAA